MSQAKLTHTLGDNINQSLLIRDNLCCFLKKLSRHMAQGTNGADRLGRELKDTRHAACKRGGNKLRCEHGKMSVDFPNEAARCQRFLSGRAQSNFLAMRQTGREAAPLFAAAMALPSLPRNPATAMFCSKNASKARRTASTSGKMQRS